MGNSFGHIFRITTFGESHGPAIGAVIDGCPPGIKIDEDFIQRELDRRKPGQSRISSQRREEDKAEILSGVFEGITTGAPILMLIRNKDQRSKDYSHIADKFRPSHADYTYWVKYGLRDYRGGGRSSARETAARVAAGAIAKLILKTKGIKIQAYVSQAGEIKINKSYNELNLDLAESNIVRCPDPDIAEDMIRHIDHIRKQKDTIGGIVSCVIKGVPAGLGEPVFDRLHADLGKAMLSINAAKGFEFGSGFKGVSKKGSEHNDLFYMTKTKVRTRTNNSGGIQGGISNGEDIYFNVAFKPVATIMMDQESINTKGESIIITGKGRHDPCVVPRAVPIVEAMAGIVIMDHYLLNNSTSNI
ncbi:chorismate synthase [Bacteroidota bacterium]